MFGQALEDSGTTKLAVHWVAKSIQELCKGPGAMAPGCLGKPMAAVAPPKWQCSGWQNLSNNIVWALVLWHWVPEQVLEASNTTRLAAQWVAESIQELCIGTGAMAPCVPGQAHGASGTTKL